MRLFPFALCGLLVACGGSVFNGGDGGPGTDGGPGADGGSDATPLDGSPCHYGQSPECPGHCPASPPSQGESCGYQDGLWCEYGTSPDPSCNQLFECTNDAWQEMTTGTICPPPTDCPATYASITPNADCNPDGLACAYDQGTCFCTTSFGGQKLTPAWSCVPATSQCPSPRPEIGAQCSDENAQCDYGSCQGGVALQCKDGNWIQVETPCPG